MVHSLLAKHPINICLILAPILLSVNEVALAVIAIVVIAHVPNLSSWVPVVWLALADVALRGAVAVVALADLAIAVNAIFPRAVVIEIVGVHPVEPDLEEPILVDWVVVLDGAEGPVVPVPSDAELVEFPPSEERNHD